MSAVKICGLFLERDIDCVNEAMPDYIGFVFAKSRRQVSEAQAGRMRARLAPGIVPVGVFVNAPVEEVAGLYRRGVIQIAQLHGAQSEAYIAALQKACGVPVIRAVRVDGRADILKAQDTLAKWLLLDSGAGCGKPFDWTMIPPLEKPWFLAGGVNEENIAAALALRPFCVDISSGAETNGYKDKDKIMRLVGRTREA